MEQHDIFKSNSRFRFHQGAQVEAILVK